MSHMDFAKSLTDTSDELIANLRSTLITASTTMLVFLVALNSFIMNIDSLLIHPRYAWISLLLSIACGVMNILLAHNRYRKDAESILKGQSGQPVQTAAGAILTTSDAGKLEHWSHLGQFVFFFLGLILSGMSLLFLDVVVLAPEPTS